MALRLREKAFTRLESYLIYLIEKGYANSEAEVQKYSIIRSYILTSCDNLLAISIRLKRPNCSF
jgi:hypothetical protein